jgi:hypothetical protein
LFRKLVYKEIEEKVEQRKYIINGEKIRKMTVGRYDERGVEIWIKMAGI